MYFIYIIKSLNRNYFYVGISNNVGRRFIEHNSGKNRTTRAYKPFKLLRSEKFPDRMSARKREKWFKSGEGKEFIKMHYL
ncbi:MAG: GIY-YIG nuclease family protein [bacterium]|nr:GIY-YIG nuclease family protein [bacterium]